VGPDGNLWFAQFNASRVGRITPEGEVTQFPTPTPNSRPVGITAGSDGNLWFTEPVGNKIGRITTEGVIDEFPLPTPNSRPIGITLGLMGSDQVVRGLVPSHWPVSTSLAWDLDPWI
jgi:virginiamycin B lyase